jgi:hypothetical protein
MANSYTQWSEQIELSKDPAVFEEQKKWINEVLERADGWEPQGYEGEPADITDDMFKGMLVQHGIDLTTAGELEFWPDFGWKISDNGVDGPMGELWLFSEESSNLDNVIAFVQAFLKKWDPKGHFTLTWADYCERLRIGEFSGGGLVITAEKFICESSHGIVRNALKELGIGEESCASPPK